LNDWKLVIALRTDVAEDNLRSQRNQRYLRIHSIGNYKLHTAKMRSVLVFLAALFALVALASAGSTSAATSVTSSSTEATTTTTYMTTSGAAPIVAGATSLLAVAVTALFGRH
jgi:hypothetical protein